MGVLVDDDTSVEAGVTPRGRVVPDVHAHAGHLAIGGSGEVGVVGARAVLGVKDDIVIAAATCAVVVHLEVASGFVEAEGVEQVVVGVRDVEQLGDRRIHVRGRSGRGRRVGKDVVVAAASTRPVVVEVAAASTGVGLRDGVVATGDSVRGRSSAVPAKLRGAGVPGVGKGLPAALSRVIQSPRAKEVVRTHSPKWS